MGNQRQAVAAIIDSPASFSSTMTGLVIAKSTAPAMGHSQAGNVLPEILKIGFKSGYSRTSVLLNRAFNFTLALVLLIICSPLSLLVTLVILIRDGRPIFYRGERMGLRKKPFQMYKFRTLVQDAEDQIEAELLSPFHNLYSPVGKYLRDSRLDELPQIFSILRGDMDFVGPRPERPSIYEKICKNIEGYDLRFQVKPGLMGISQLFTPHNTPKRLRAFIDNKLVHKKQKFLWDAYAITITGLLVLKTSVRQTAKYFYQEFWQPYILRNYREVRGLERVQQRNARVEFGGTSLNDLPRSVVLIDMNENCFLMRSERRVKASEFPERFVLCVLTQVRGGRSKRKIAHCTGKLLREVRLEMDCYEYVVEYEPISPLNSYKVYQYFLNKSIA